MKKVRDIMRPGFLFTVELDAPVTEAVRVMAIHDVGIVSVVDEDHRLVGLFSERDVVRRVVGRGLSPGLTPVAHVMTTDIIVADADEDYESAIRKMDGAGIRHLPVLSEGYVLSMISIRDLIRVDRETTERSCATSANISTRIRLRWPESAPGWRRARALEPRAETIIAPGAGHEDEEQRDQRSRRIHRQGTGAAVLREGSGACGEALRHVWPKEGPSMKQIFAVVLGLTLLAQSSAAWAQPGSRESTSEQVAYGTGSVLGTLVYAPVKASFCILGAVSSGFAFPIAGPRTAGKIASSTCGGTWAITPDELKGREPVRFVGN